jgi:hypothetical protein
MKFKRAVELTPGVKACYRPGLQALSKNDAKRISCENPRQLTGSINVDHALQSAQPQANRWDYGIGLQRGENETAVWVEVHPASSASISDMLNKLEWLKNWLRSEAPELRKLTGDGFYWVSTEGPIAITPNSTYAKQLASVGLHGPMRVLNLK